MNAELWVRLRLSLQCAMWESVTPDLRGVAIALNEADRPHSTARFLYSDAVGDLREELVSLVETCLIADFSKIPADLAPTFSAVPYASRELREASTGSSSAGSPDSNVET